MTHDEREVEIAGGEVGAKRRDDRQTRQTHCMMKEIIATYKWQSQWKKCECTYIYKYELCNLQHNVINEPDRADLASQADHRSFFAHLAQWLKGCSVIDGCILDLTYQRFTFKHIIDSL